MELQEIAALVERVHSTAAALAKASANHQRAIELEQRAHEAVRAAHEDFGRARNALVAAAERD